MMNIETHHVKNIYNEIAKEFDVTRTYTWKWVGDFLTDIPNQSIICDLGCGNGRNMKSDRHNFIGIDNCSAFVDLCNNQNLNVKKGEMIDIPMIDGSVDHIICIAAFHHLSTHENRVKALTEMKRILNNNNSKILLSVWSKQQPKKTRVTFDKYGDTMVSWKHKYDRYYYIFKISELEDIIHEAGLTIEKHLYDCGNEIFVLTK